MKFGSVCSGIEAASCAWEPLGWKASFLSEIAAFPRAVLFHHYPDTPLRGDFTEIQPRDHDAIDVLVGGTPCQSFSVAGLRRGMADERGNLALEYLRLADRLRPRWLVWENVPGVLSSNGGRDFGSFLGGLGQLGYGWAYRVLDAQYFALAQRRARVFVVGYLGDWRRAAAVLFEPASLRGHPPPRRQAGQGVARPPTPGAPGGSGYRNDADTADDLIPDTAAPLAFGGNKASGAIDLAPSPLAQPGSGWKGDFDSETFIAHTLRASGFDASEDGTGRGTPLVPVGYTIHGTDPTVQRVASEDHLAQCLRARTPGNIDNSSTTTVLQPIPFDLAQITSATNRTRAEPGLPVSTMASNSRLRAAAMSMVRRLTPRECERLQGFPDDQTLIPYRGKPAADGPRYQALGNSMAVPVMGWIGRRIQMVEAQS